MCASRISVSVGLIVASGAGEIPEGPDWAHPHPFGVRVGPRAHVQHQHRRILHGAGDRSVENGRCTGREGEREQVAEGDE